MNPWGLAILGLGVFFLVLSIRDTGGTLLDGLGWTHGSYSNSPSTSTSSNSDGTPAAPAPASPGAPVQQLPDSPNLN